MKKLNIKSVAIEAVATGAGAVVAAKGDSMLDKIGFLTGKPMFKGAAKVIAGILIPHFLGKGKSAGVAKAFGNGMVAIGSAQLANGTVFKASPMGIAGIGLPVLGEADTSNFITEDYVSSLPTLGDTGDNNNI